MKTYSWLIWTICVLAASVAVIFVVQARDLDGKYAQSPLKPWFNSLKSKGGAWCCDGADGQRLEDVDWQSADGHYRVRVDGEWIDVPEGGLIEEPNRAGPAIVWPYKDETGKVQVRCFIPGAGT